MKDYHSEDGFPSDLHIYVFKIEEETVFCTKQGIYTYNETQDRFEANPKWNEVFGEKNLGETTDRSTKWRCLVCDE